MSQGLYISLQTRFSLFSLAFVVVVVVVVFCAFLEQARQFEFQSYRGV